IKFCHMGLSTIFYYYQMMFFCYFHNGNHMGRKSADMNRQNCSGTGSNFFFYFSGIYLESIFIGIYKNRDCPCSQYSINSGNKGKRRYNYFISTSNTQLNKRDNQCICTIHNCYTATGTNCFSKLIFEFLNYSGTGPDTAPYN